MTTRSYPQRRVFFLRVRKLPPTYFHLARVLRMKGICCRTLDKPNPSHDLYSILSYESSFVLRVLAKRYQSLQQSFNNVIY